MKLEIPMKGMQLSSDSCLTQPINVTLCLELDYLTRIVL
jgi:hypothetical protein